MGPEWKPATLVVAVGLLAAACSTSTSSVASTASETATPGPPTESAQTDSEAPVATPEPAPTSDIPAASCPVVEPAEALGPSVELTVLAEDPLIEAAVYPRPTYEGNPWSQWGQGALLPDGRFVSAIGDHLGPDGNSYLYQYDPATGQLAMVGDVSSLVEHRAGEWGYGKIHGQLVPVGCDQVVFATYWGSRRDLRYTASYPGDFLAAWDTSDQTFEVLTVPVPNHGIPSLSGSAADGVIYGEAVDPSKEGNQGVFFAYDVESGQVTTVDGVPHVGFRNVLVDSEGGALFAAGDAALVAYDPESQRTSIHPAKLPGEWLRAATLPGPDGTVYGSTRDPDALFALSPEGEIRSLGEARGYVASLALSADGGTLFYVPGAHGHAWEQGTPIIAVDVATGDQRIIAELNDLAEQQLGLRLGGTYNIVADPDGTRLYVGFNAGSAGEESFGEVVLAIVHLDPSPPTESGIVLEDATDTFGLVDPLTGMHGHAAAAADVDGDGWSDLVVGSFGDRPPEAYAMRGADGPSPDRHLSGGPGGFVVAGDLGPSGMRTSGSAWADLDNDGDFDLVLSRNVRNDVDQTVLYENDGGSLVEAAVLDRSRGARSVGVLDYDLDGLPDLLLTEDKWSGGSSVLLRNRGDFSFEDATGSADLPDDVHALGIGVADLTGDGHADLVFGGSNRIFVADGDGGFGESAASPLPWETFGDEDDPAGVAIADLNRDGWLDVVIGQHHGSTLDAGQKVAVRLFLNRGPDGSGDPVLEDVTADAGLVPLPTKAPHVQIVDLDNDGWPDIVTSASSADGTQPAIFSHTGALGANGVPSFRAPTGLGDDQYWVSGAAADFDNDGRQDLFFAEWEPSLPSKLWLNKSEAGHWIEIEATIGSVVSVFEPGGSLQSGALIGSRSVVGSTGYGGGAEPVAHFGVGRLEAVDIVVMAPGGQETTLTGVAADTRISLD